MKQWLIDSLQNALSSWSRIQELIVGEMFTSPDVYRSGSIWTVMTTIYGGIQSIGYALLVLFFVIGVIKTCGSFSEMKRPELALKLFVRFAIAKAVITYGLDILLVFIRIAQGVIGKIYISTGLTPGTAITVPDEVIEAIENSRLFENIPLVMLTWIGILLIWVVSLVILIACFGRMFKVFMYVAVSPIPLATFAGEPTQNIGKSFLKSFAGVCMEGVVILLACAIFTAYGSTSLISGPDTNVTNASIVWNYFADLMVYLFVLAAAIKTADRVSKEMMGL